MRPSSNRPRHVWQHHHRREDLQSGLEPDACFYIEHEADVRDHEEIDLAIHPPPDLVLEVEISRSTAGRLAIYAEMGVPEVWRTDGDVLRMCRLDEEGTYREVRESQALPGLKPDDLRRFLALRTEVDESTLTIQFREWMSGGV
ncbi:MAG: Uma2 family endonuclease [Planctomycetaceae bacterium]|nr:Uma2 family endonuclease [Planctomycetaceae bacterium]